MTISPAVWRHDATFLAIIAVEILGGPPRGDKPTVPRGLFSPPMGNGSVPSRLVRRLSLLATWQPV